jgi:hypothetical protein
MIAARTPRRRLSSNCLWLVNIDFYYYMICDYRTGIIIPFQSLVNEDKLKIMIDKNAVSYTFNAAQRSELEWHGNQFQLRVQTFALGIRKVSYWYNESNLLNFPLPSWSKCARKTDILDRCADYHSEGPRRPDPRLTGWRFQVFQWKT